VIFEGLSALFDIGKETRQPSDGDAGIVAIALRQHGNITVAQLHQLGVNDNAIFHRVRRGSLHRLHRGVFSVGRPARMGPERASAAVLACGSDAALSHQGALVLWGFTRAWPTTFDVTVTRGNPHPRGITVHRSAALTRRDLRVQLEIRATSPARTILDCAAGLDGRARTRTVNDALHTPFLTQAQLADVRHRFPTHPGARLLDEFLDPGQGATRSPFEDDFIAFCVRFGLPRPVTNTFVAGYEADAVFPEHRLIVELDGWEFHRQRDAFESDRDRDADTLRARYATVRITKLRLTRTPAAEAPRLHDILAGRAPRTPD
jgi:hypothetical protein